MTVNLKIPKNHTIPFNKEHALQHSLEIVFKHAKTREVDSVRCKFCISHGREGFVCVNEREM